MGPLSRKVTGAIEILCDGGTHGFGHLRRASSLAWQLQRRGHKTRVTALSPQARKLLPPSPADLIESELMVIDLPAGAETHIAHARTASKRCVALDYFGNAQPDLTISVLERTSPPPPGKRVAGLEFALVREEVRVQKPARPGAGILVIFGGSDATRQGPKVTKWLASQGQEVTWVEGPLALSSTETPTGVRRLKVPDDLPRLMADCRWAVANGGVTMMELLSLGKPVWVVPQTPDEKRLAQHIFEQGGLLGVGNLRKLPSTSRMETIDKTAERLVDGRGIERICKLIEEALL